MRPDIAKQQHWIQQANEASIDSTDSVAFVKLVRILAPNPDVVESVHIKPGSRSGQPDIDVAGMYTSFIKGREPKKPKPPETVTDRIVEMVLQQWFEHPQEKLEDISRTHKDAMGAENIVGDLLERYLANRLEPVGYVWCSGSVVKKIDFIRVFSSKVELLQIKNRSNSENSSSKSVRDGTNIRMWFRAFSHKDVFNWDNFPDERNKLLLSEDGFRKFVTGYLRSLKSEK
jgi:hypothetical protein